MYPTGRVQASCYTAQMSCKKTETSLLWFLLVLPKIQQLALCCCNSVTFCFFGIKFVAASVHEF